MKIYKKIVDFFTQVGTYRIVTNPGKGETYRFYRSGARFALVAQGQDIRKR